MKDPSEYIPKVETRERRLVDLFNFTDEEDVEEFGFDIPAIQRDYTWGFGSETDAGVNDSAWRLLKDLIDFHEGDPEGEETYFLGTVILFKMGGSPRLQIMDGQQRMTSLVALMSMIRHALQFYGKDMELQDMGGGTQTATSWAEEVRVDFLEYREMASISPKVEADGITLDQLVDLSGWMDPLDEEEGNAYLSPSGSVTNSRINGWLGYKLDGSYLYLASIGYWLMIKEWIDTDNDGEISRSELEELVRFYDTLRYRVIVNRTITPEIGLAYRMFVTANTRGKPLNNFDLFRGLVIARAYELEFPKESTDSLSSFLQRCEERLDDKVKGSSNDDKRSQEIDKIMAYSASVRHGKKIEAKNVATTFEREIRDRIEDIGDMATIVADTLSFISHWNEFLDKRVGWTYAHPLSPEYLIYRRLSRLGITQHLPYVAVMRMAGWDEEEVHEFMWLLECFVMRTMVAGGASIGGDMYGLMKFAKEIYDGEDSSIVLSKLREHLMGVSVRKNPEGWSGIEKRQVDTKRAYVILHSTDSRMEWNDPGPGTKGLHCFQLMPRYDYAMRMKGWEFTNSERIASGHDSKRIGNWFLVRGTAGDLKKYKDSAPYKKIAHWKEVGVNETVEALDWTESEWGASDIDDRTSEIMERCEVHYPETFERPRGLKKN